MRECEFDYTTAAVLRDLNCPLEVERLLVADPDFGEVKVRVLAAGICGAQLQDIRGDRNNKRFLPHLLGHEGCGVVEAIGSGVKTVKVGDRVVMHWRKGDGIDAEGGFYQREDNNGTSIVNAGPIHTFCTHAVVAENRVTTVPNDTPSDLCCLLGCALSTALGVLENDAKLRMGERVLVVGCGGVGLSLISAAKMLGASVFATDKNDTKAAAHSVMSPYAFSVIDSKVNWSTMKVSFDCIIDTTGSEDAILQTMPLLASGGRYILVGQPAPGESLRIPNARQLFEGTGATIIASQGGQFNPAQDLPRYVRLWRAGLLQAAGITHRLPLERINEGLDLMREGKAGRVIIEMNP